LDGIDVADTSAILTTLNAGHFQRVSLNSLHALEPGVTTAIWTQRPNDPMHMVLVERSTANEWLVAETQFAGDRRYTAFDLTNNEIPDALAGPLQVPVTTTNHLAQVTPDGVRPSSTPVLPDRTLDALLDPSSTEDSRRPGRSQQARDRARYGALPHALPAPPSTPTPTAPDAWVATSVSGLAPWDGTPDCLIRVDSVLTGLGVPRQRTPDDSNIVATAEIADRLGGTFTPTATSALTALPAGAVTVAWTQHPNDPQHVVLVHRPSAADSPLLVVETQLHDNRRYTTFTPSEPGADSASPKALRGPVRLPVDEQGHLRWVDANTGVGSSPLPVANTTVATALTDPAQSARPGVYPGGGHGQPTNQGQHPNQGHYPYGTPGQGQQQAPGQYHYPSQQQGYYPTQPPAQYPLPIQPPIYHPYPAPTQTQYQQPQYLQPQYQQPQYPVSLIGQHLSRSQRVARAAYEMVGRLLWRGGSGPDGNAGWREPATTSHGYRNDFLHWLQDGTGTVPEPSPVTAVMNCWQVVFFSAYRAGLVTKAQLQDIHQQASSAAAAASDAKGHELNSTRAFSDIRDFGRQMARAGQGAYYATLEQSLYRGNLSQYQFASPTGANPTDIPVGNVVIFDSLYHHVALSLGVRDAQGRQLVMSLWNFPQYAFDPADIDPNSDGPQDAYGWMQLTSVEELVQAGRFQFVRFGRLAWA